MKIIRFTPTVKTQETALKAFCSKSIRIPYSIEMVYLPYLLFAYSIIQSFITGKKNKSRGLFLVDLVQGIPVNIKNKTMFEISPALEKEMKTLIGDFPVGQNRKNPLAIDRENIEEDKLMPVLLEEEEAISRGRKLLMYDIMKFSGPFRKSEITALDERKQVYYPYWLIYYKDRKGTTDFAVLDALNRNRETGDIKRSISLALVKKHLPK